MVNVNEAEERARQEAQVAERKRKREAQQVWEGECFILLPLERFPEGV